MLNNDGCIEGYEAGLWKFEDEFLMECLICEPKFCT